MSVLCVCVHAPVWACMCVRMCVRVCVCVCVCEVGLMCNLMKASVIRHKHAQAVHEPVDNTEHTLVRPVHS